VASAEPGEGVALPMVEEMIVGEEMKTGGNARLLRRRAPDSGEVLVGTVNRGCGGR